MHPTQMDELMRASQENAWLAGTYLNLVVFFVQHLAFFTILWVGYLISWLFLINDNLKHESGVDRFMWLFLLMALPLFGPLFYLRRLLEREAADFPPGSRPGWKRSIG